MYSGRRFFRYTFDPGIMRDQRNYPFSKLLSEYFLVRFLFRSGGCFQHRCVLFGIVSQMYHKRSISSVVYYHIRTFASFETKEPVMYTTSNRRGSRLSKRKRALRRLLSLLLHGLVWSKYYNSPIVLRRLKLPGFR